MKLMMLQLKRKPTIVLQPVDEIRSVVKRFESIIHVPNTRSISPKTSFEAFICKYKLWQSCVVKYGKVVLSRL